MLGRVMRIKLRQCTKFHVDLSNGCQDMTIFQFFKMAAAAMLDFRNFKIVMIGADKRVKLRHHIKFPADRSNRCGDMTIFKKIFQGGF